MGTGNLTTALTALPRRPSRLACFQRYDAGLGGHVLPLRLGATSAGNVKGPCYRPRLETTGRRRAHGDGASYPRPFPVTTTATRCAHPIFITKEFLNLLFFVGFSGDCEIFKSSFLIILRLAVIVLMFNLKKEDFYRIIVVVFGAIILGEYLFLYFSNHSSPRSSAPQNMLERVHLTLNATVVGYEPFLLVDKPLPDPCVASTSPTSKGFALLIKPGCNLSELYSHLRKKGAKAVAEVKFKVPSTVKIGNEEITFPHSVLVLSDAPIYNIGENVSLRISALVKNGLVVGLEKWTVLPSLRTFTSKANVRLKAVVCTAENATSFPSAVPKGCNLTKHELVCPANTSPSSLPDELNCSFSYLLTFSIRGNTIRKDYLSPVPLPSSVLIQYKAYNLPEIRDVMDVKVVNATASNE